MAGWNIAAAVAATRIASTKSKHQCAKYVRTYMEAGGMSTAGRPVAAWSYMGYLPTKGFSCIAKLTGLVQQRNFTATQAKPGDIAVMDHGKYGHICMWNGSRWVSDFIQNNMWVYSGQGTCYVWRYAGAITDGRLYIPDALGRIHAKQIQMQEEDFGDPTEIASASTELVRVVRAGAGKKFVDKVRSYKQHV